MLEVAELKARPMGLTSDIAIFDEGANLIVFHRKNNARIADIENSHYFGGGIPFVNNNGVTGGIGVRVMKKKPLSFRLTVFLCLTINFTLYLITIL